MKSKEGQVPFDQMPDEDKLMMSKIMLDSGARQIDKAIDEFTSANLKRVLKILSHVHIANAILDKEENIELNDKEKDLIDKIFALHESVMGHKLLQDEIEKSSSDNLEANIESSLESNLSTNLETSLEDNNE